MYFSRAPIPFARDGNAADLWEEWHAAGETAPWRVHIGVYAYRPRFLQEVTALPVSALEQIEKLEQLRALEAGATIQVGEVPRPTEAVDTPDDYARFVRRWRDLRRGAA
jgi:3-deoxy-manno-octulosonate cytidylyltransferase (CMP-KDO synthetase)